MTAAGGGVLGRASRSFAWDLVAIAASTVGSIFLARLVGPTDRGIIAVMLVLVGVVVIVALLGNNVAYRTLHPKGLVSLQSYLGIVGSNSILAGVACAVLAPLSLFVAAGAIDPWAVAAAAVLGVIALVSLATLDACKAAGQLVRSSQIEALGAIVTSVLIITNPVKSVAAYLACYIGGHLLRVVLALIASRAEGAGSRDERRLNRGSGRRFATYAVGQHLATQSEPYFVGLALGATSAGFYSVAAAIAGLLKLPAVAIGQVLHYESARGNVAWRRLRVIVLLSTLATAGGAVLALLVSETLVIAVFGEEYRAAVPVLRVLLLAQVALAPYPLLARALAGADRARELSLVAVIGAITSAVGIVGMGFAFGLVGAGVASVVVYAGLAAATLVIARRAFTDNGGPRS